ncbi:MAG: hypothetical protein R2867_45390 [Caldilineaceae bacterium]
MQIRDDGAGFDPEQTAADRFGLTGMRERAAMVGGTLTIDSDPGAGTVITLTVPSVRLG